MSYTADRGPIQTYEVTWRSGHVEKVQAHQVLTPQPENPFSFMAVKSDRRQRWFFHGEVEGQWRLVLAADEDEITAVRLVSTPEPIPGDAGGDPS